MQLIARHGIEVRGEDERLRWADWESSLQGKFTNETTEGDASDGDLSEPEDVFPHDSEYNVNRAPAAFGFHLGQDRTAMSCGPDSFTVMAAMTLCSPGNSGDLVSATWFELLEPTKDAICQSQGVPTYDDLPPEHRTRFENYSKKCSSMLPAAAATGQLNRRTPSKHYYRCYSQHPTVPA